MCKQSDSKEPIYPQTQERNSRYPAKTERHIIAPPIWCQWFTCTYVCTDSALLPPIWSRFLSLRLTQNSLKIRLALLRILEISPRYVVPSRNATRFSAKSNSYVCSVRTIGAGGKTPGSVLSCIMSLGLHTCVLYGM